MSHEPVSKTDLRLLDPRAVQLRADALGRLRLQVGIEERYEPVKAVRCLPLTQPERFISFQDEAGDEIGVLEEVASLDPESLRVLRTELEQGYLKARVTKIHRVEARNGIITWELTTDLGEKRVHIRDRNNIRPLPDGRIVLTDIHEGKYEVPPIDQLDEASRKWLEIEL